MVSFPMKCGYVVRETRVICGPVVLPMFTLLSWPENNVINAAGVTHRGRNNWQGKQCLSCPGVPFLLRFNKMPKG